MNTPCQPVRRKLKRVLKKVDKLNSSSKISSQKKLKAAINTSLNSTNSLRSLKNNNYSLAMRLENVKQDLRMSVDEKNYLLEENFGLKEKVNTLEQMLGDRETYILQEVERKVTARVEGIKKVIRSLNSHMSNICVDLEQLTQICAPRTSSLEHPQSLDSAGRRSGSGDSGDNCFQTESERYGWLATSPKTKTFTGHDISNVDELYPNDELSSSSMTIVKHTERGMQKKTNLPRRVRRSLNCPEVDEDICVDLDGLPRSADSEKRSYEDNDMDSTELYDINDIQPPSLLSLEERDMLDDEQVEINDHKKAVSVSKNKRGKKSSKQPSSSVDKSKDLHIANEFALINAHKTMMEKTVKDNEQANPEQLNLGCWDEEQTVCIVQDMELTMSVDTTVTIPPINNTECLETFRENLNSAKPSRLSEYSEENSRVSQVLDELVPDAVTMRKSKPGQLKFAVGRKDSEGCRKEIVNVPRARSKSKKRIAELAEQLPQEEPKSIFDFHEKTPTFIPEGNNEALSVYSLAEESTTSPYVPFKETVSRRNTLVIGEAPVANQDKVTYSEPLKDSPSKTPKKISTVSSRSRSRRRTKIVEHSLNVAKNHTDSNTDQENSNKYTLLDSITYSEPLKDNPSNSPEKKSRGSRSRSRRRTKQLHNLNEDHLPDTEEIVNQEEINLIDGETYSEPLRDSPINIPKKNSRVSRSRSRRKTKNSLNVNEKDLSETENETQKETEAFTSIKEAALSESFKDSPHKSPIRMSKVSRSRSQRKTKNEDYLSYFDDTVQDENDFKGKRTTHRKSTNSKTVPDNPISVSNATLKSPNSQSQRGTSTVISSCNFSDANDDVLRPETDSVSLELEHKRFTLLGEGITYSEPLKDSPVKTPKVSKRSRSQTRRLTRSTGRSLKSSNTDVTDKRTRSVSRKKKSGSEKRLSFDSDYTTNGSKDHSIERTGTSTSRLKEPSFVEEGDSSSISKDHPLSETEKVSDSTVGDKNDLEHLNNISETEEPLLNLDPEITSGNNVKGRRNKSNKSKSVEKDTIKIFELEMEQEIPSNCDNGLREHSPHATNSNNTKKSQIPKESKSIKKRRGRKDNLNQEMNLNNEDDNCNGSDSSSIKSNNVIPSSNNHESKQSDDSISQKDVYSVKRNSVDEKIDNCDLEDENSTKQLHAIVEGGVTGNDISTKADDQKNPNCCIEKPSKKSRKRKLIDKEESSNVNHSESVNKSSSNSKSNGNRYSKTSPEDSVNSGEQQYHDVDSVSRGIKDQHSKNLSALETEEVNKEQKNSSNHTSKPVKHQVSPLKHDGKQRISAASRNGSPNANLRKGSISDSRDSSSNLQPERQRRTKQVVNYAEPSVGKKLRRGDPFTVTGGNLQIFKSPKLQGKKKNQLNQSVLESHQNLPITDTSIME